jgi:DNA-binding CsgD family transcriptional regulator
LENHLDYTIFKQFIAKYEPQGFLNIDRQDPLVVDMEEKLRKGNQFFYIADLIQIKVLFTSQGCQDILGIEPESVGAGVFYYITHPDDLMRYNLSRAKLFKSGHDLFVKQEGISVLSISFRLKNKDGQYADILFQGYSFYSEIIYKTVFHFFVFTDISSFKMENPAHHHYLGDNPAFFRYPDKKLLQTGHAFSNREFEILQLIATGMDSEQIAKKLQISLNTVNTHRRNLLKKTRKQTTLEIVIELQERGIL